MKISMNKLIFYIAYILMLVSIMFSRVKGISNYINVIDMFSMSLFLILFILNTFIFSKTIKVKRIFYLLIVFFLCIISYFYSKDFLMLKFFFLVDSFKYFDFNSFLKKDILIKTIFLLTIIILYYLGLTNNEVFTRVDGTSRISFGFSHPNVFGAFLMMISLEIAYLFHKKNPILVSILILFLSCISNIFSDSRASLLIVILSIILIIINSFIDLKFIENKIIKFIIKNSFIIFTFLTLILVFYYRKEYEFPYLIDDITSGRIKWASNYLSNYNINLFGNDLYIPNKFEWIDYKIYYCLDNSNIYFLLHYGIVFWFILSTMFRKVFEKLYNEKNYFLILILFILTIYGLMETYLVKFQYNAFLLLIAFILEKGVKKDENISYNSSI